MIERAVEVHDQGVAPARAGRGQRPTVPGATCSRTSGPIWYRCANSCRRGRPAESRKRSVDNHPDRPAGLERVAGLVVRDQAALQPGRIEEHGQAAAASVPQLGVDVKKGIVKFFARGVVHDVDVVGRASVAHRGREVHVKAQLVVGNGGGGGIDRRDGRGGGPARSRARTDRHRRPGLVRYPTVVIGSASTNTV